MQRLPQLLSFLLLLAINTAASAADGPLINKPLPSLPANQEMLVLEINLAPGQESAPHRHNAHVFVYVLEGKVNMQVAGGELVTLGPGEMFYEDPESIHSVSQNASETEPARILVHLIKTIGAPVSAAVSP